MTSLPRRKEVEPSGPGQSGTLVVTFGADRGEATCPGVGRRRAGTDGDRVRRPRLRRPQRVLIAVGARRIVGPGRAA
ncbi:hypothetical protein J7E88_14285 [Streptomyces sp. ISL-10]|uniref:hypothetical protein n=1 Tax=Streptomyces sp. ISL-10 TaxID=2819172 RepID=UPI001BED30D9|nr:hypothetical protein [Streptomyces sp. ISL-10]MBT2366443.1 hypothetical protein [Streptomyces sp. ISL-10]